ncbi:MAG: Mov34/MPN/PAD-1 family protein [Pirellulales bacterium]
MSNIDVRDLAKETLPEGRFPASAKADFRVFMVPEVHRGTWAHAKKDVSVEICGVLVGSWKHDDDGPFAVITNFIPCENAASKFAEVTFTHESWAHINREMDTRFANDRIIGWYHSHPDFGIFLSDRDCFIQEHFFSGPGQIAYVVDPVRGLEGVFTWRAGKPTPLAHYWIGDTIRTVEASQSAAGEKPSRSHGELPTEVVAAAAPVSRRQSSLDLVATILSWIALFLLGYLIADMKSRWDQQMIVEGTVAHYGYNKLMKIGLEDNLAKVRLQLTAIASALDHLPDASAELTEEEQETADKQRKMIGSALAVSDQMLGDIQTVYGMTDQERTALLELIAQKQAALRGLAESKAAAAKKNEPPRADPNSAKQAPETTSAAQVNDVELVKEAKQAPPDSGESRD